MPHLALCEAPLSSRFSWHPGNQDLRAALSRRGPQPCETELWAPQSLEERGALPAPSCVGDQQPKASGVLCFS